MILKCTSNRYFFCLISYISIPCFSLINPSFFRHKSLPTGQAGTKSLSLLFSILNSQFSILFPLCFSVSSVVNFLFVPCHKSLPTDRQAQKHKVSQSFLFSLLTTHYSLLATQNFVDAPPPELLPPPHDPLDELLLLR